MRYWTDSSNDPEYCFLYEIPLEASEDTLETACLIGLLCKYRVSSGVLSFWAVIVTGWGKIVASLDIREIDSGDSPVEDASLLTVGGS
jgi:hypothetical protein